MPLTAPPPEVLAAFEALQLPDIKADPTGFNDTLRAFVARWMSPPGHDLQPPSQNFTAEAPPAGSWCGSMRRTGRGLRRPSINVLPVFVCALDSFPERGWMVPQDLPDPEVRDWAESLYHTWGSLAREVAGSVEERPELNTVLSVPNPFVIAGGRFREGGWAGRAARRGAGHSLGWAGLAWMAHRVRLPHPLTLKPAVYYWDSLFVIIKGLLATNLPLLAADIVGNFIFLINNYGHIPNGARLGGAGKRKPARLPRG